MSLIADRVTVANKLPPNAREINYNGIIGWSYSINCSLGNRYTFFAYNDGSLYQVLVLFPAVAGQYDIHKAHLFSDGRICFGQTLGLPTLEQVYAKSVLWATGFSTMLRTGTFQLSKNNF